LVACAYGSLRLLPLHAPPVVAACAGLRTTLRTHYVLRTRTRWFHTAAHCLFCLVVLPTPPPHRAYTGSATYLRLPPRLPFVDRLPGSRHHTSSAAWFAAVLDLWFFTGWILPPAVCLLLVLDSVRLPARLVIWILLLPRTHARFPFPRLVTFAARLRAARCCAPHTRALPYFAPYLLPDRFMRCRLHAAVQVLLLYYATWFCAAVTFPHTTLPPAVHSSLVLLRSTARFWFFGFSSMTAFADPTHHTRFAHRRYTFPAHARTRCLPHLTTIRAPPRISRTAFTARACWFCALLPHLPHVLTAYLRFYGSGSAARGFAGSHTYLCVAGCTTATQRFTSTRSRTFGLVARLVRLYPAHVLRCLDLVIGLRSFTARTFAPRTGLPRRAFVLVYGCVTRCCGYCAHTLRHCRVHVTARLVWLLRTYAVTRCRGLRLPAALFVRSAAHVYYYTFGVYPHARLLIGLFAGSFRLPATTTTPVRARTYIRLLLHRALLRAAACGCGSTYHTATPHYAAPRFCLPDPQVRFTVLRFTTVFAHRWFMPLPAPWIRHTVTAHCLGSPFACASRCRTLRARCTRIVCYIRTYHTGSGCYPARALRADVATTYAARLQHPTPTTTLPVTSLWFIAPHLV